MNASVTPVRVHVLINPWGWKFAYLTHENGPDWNTVKVVRKWKGEEMETLEMSRDEARQHYACQMKNGFINPISI